MRGWDGFRRAWTYVGEEDQPGLNRRATGVVMAYKECQGRREERAGRKEEEGKERKGT